MPESWIIDASPLIILARIARLDWFERVDRAQTAGLFLDPALVSQVLSTVGE